MLTLFVVACALVLWTYGGYPALMLLRARLARERRPEPPARWPAVTVIVPFCNEPERVAPKRATLAALDYPGALQIIFVADGDGATGAAVRAAPDVEAVVLPQRRGKPAALNAALARARHELVLFTDARQVIDPPALRALVTRMEDAEVGAVSGELIQRTETDAERVGLYWRYELALRKAESRVDSVPGVSGALYLMRRELCRPLPEDTLLDDVEMPLNAIRAGYRVVLEENARVFDVTAPSVQLERRRKLRTLTGNYQLFARHPWLLLPWRNPAWLAFTFHKAARLVAPWALLAMFVTPLALPGAGWRLVWAAQAAFYLMAFGSGRAWPLCGHRLAATARLFTELNLTAAQAAWHYLRAPVDPRWEKTS